MSAARPKVILWEADLRWNAAWRRCVGAPSRLVAVKSPAEIRKALAEAPASVVVVEFSAVPRDALLEWLAERTFGQCDWAVMLVGGAELEPWRWRLMELGAMLVVTSERDLPAACDAARRHLQRWKPPELGLRERIWESLPWGDESN